ncbi:MAG: transcriptional regulator [Agitococcus sp.]|jgi:hypothetical protein|nr:transcriptional regulator [Agitococcus sp.]HQV80995.1 DUF6516 family protein [Agitococcus sp.]
MKTKKQQEKRTVEECLLSEQRKLSKASGGGILKYEMYGYKNAKGDDVVTRYSIAWINPMIYTGDNGRVLGFDNAHDYHHRHLMGKIEPVEFSNFEATYDRFVEEWQTLVALHKGM